MSDDDIIEAISHTEPENEGEDSPPPPTPKQAASAMLTIRRFFESQPNADSDLRVISQLEDKIAITVVKVKRQTGITEFFIK